jgi:hypothetical protein
VQVVCNHGSQFASQNIDPLEAARTLAEELKSVSGKLATWQPGNLGEEFILGRSDWGCFELKEERDRFGYAVTVFVSLEYCTLSPEAVETRARQLASR